MNLYHIHTHTDDSRLYRPDSELFQTLVGVKQGRSNRCGGVGDWERCVQLIRGYERSLAISDSK